MKQKGQKTLRGRAIATMHAGIKFGQAGSAGSQAAADVGRQAEVRCELGGFGGVSSLSAVGRLSVSGGFRGLGG